MHFPALSGTLTLSYFIHNAVLTILRNQKHPENNARDLSIGYCLVAFCYVFIGFTFFAAFPVQRSCISDVRFCSYQINLKSIISELPK